MTFTRYTRTSVHIAARHTIIQKILLWFWRTVHLHIALTAFSLPLLFAWGLPLSLMGIAGNIVFVPFLLAFLVLASCIFVGELLCLPTGFFTWFIERIYTVWRSCISLASHKALIEFAQPSLFIVCLLSISIIGLFHYRATTRLPIRCAQFLFFIALACALVHVWCAPRYAIVKLDEDFPLLTFIRANKTILCVDQGTSCKAANIAQRVHSKLLHPLRKRLGSTDITTLILLKPTASSYTLAQHLLGTSSSNRTIILPACKGYVTPAVRRALQHLTKWAEQQGHTIFFLPSDITESCSGTDASITACAGTAFAGTACAGTGFPDTAGPVKQLVLKLSPKIDAYITVHGILPRTTRFSHPLLSVTCTSSLLPVAIMPAITRREQALLQRPLKPMANT